jgi:hypothetical protein
MKTFLRALFTVLLTNLIFQPQPYVCEEAPQVQALLDEMSQARWVNWIGDLSGEREIHTDTGKGRILTRSSFVMFEPDIIPSAFQYLQAELEEMGFTLGDDFIIHTYDFPYEDRHPERNWKNLVLTFPGSNPKLAKERVLLAAHLDSTSGQELTLAPGADDNASGAAGLLEAAAVLRHFQFKRTLHLIWFSGEEQSRNGSEYFVEDYEGWLPEIVGVINLDMFAFDWDEDRCFEVHAGTLPGSHQIGECLMQVIKAYSLDLSFDYIDDDSAYTFSDHNAFWLEGVPAVMVFENGFYQPGLTCGKADRNYAYHTTADRLVYINQETGFSILQASLAAAAHMADPLGACFSEGIEMDSRRVLGKTLLSWDPLPEAAKYLVWGVRKSRWQLVGETVAPRWLIHAPEKSGGGPYRIFAVTEGRCQSLPGYYPQQ